MRIQEPASTNEMIALLRRHRAELQSFGVEHVAIFGSVARGDDGPDSDVDVVVELDPRRRRRGLAYFGQLDRIKARLRDILKREVDVVSPPFQSERFSSRVQCDARRAF